MYGSINTFPLGHRYDLPGTWDLEPRPATKWQVVTESGSWLQTLFSHLLARDSLLSTVLNLIQVSSSLKRVYQLGREPGTELYYKELAYAIVEVG